MRRIICLNTQLCRICFQIESFFFLFIKVDSASYWNYLAASHGLFRFPITKHSPVRFSWHKCDPIDWMMVMTITEPFPFFFFFFCIPDLIIVGSTISNYLFGLWGPLSSYKTSGIHSATVSHMSPTAHFWIPVPKSVMGTQEKFR